MTRVSATLVVDKLLTLCNPATFPVLVLYIVAVYFKMLYVANLDISGVPVTRELKVPNTEYSSFR